MPYVYVPSSSYGGNTAPQVGGYRGPGQDPRKRRGPSKSSGQIMAELREEALQREKHLLELEKIREERRAFAKRQKEAKDAERAARQPAATQPSQAGAYYGPSSTEQPKLQEQRAYQNIQSSPTSAPTPATAPTRAPAAPKPAAAPAPVAAPTTPSVMPSAVYNPNENRNLLDVYGTLEEPSRAAISTYLNAQNRAAVNRQVQDAVAPAFSAPTVADRRYDDVEQIRARSNVLADKPAALSASQIMRLVDPEEMDRTEARVAGRAAEMRDEREKGMDGSMVFDLPQSSEPFRFTPEQQQALRFQPDRRPTAPHPLRLMGNQMASNAAGIGRSLGRAFSERFFPSYQPAEILPTSAMDPEVAALQQSQYINRLGDLVPASMRDPRSMYYFPGKFY